MRTYHVWQVANISFLIHLGIKLSFEISIIVFILSCLLRCIGRPRSFGLISSFNFAIKPSAEYALKSIWHFAFRRHWLEVKSIANIKYISYRCPKLSPLAALFHRGVTQWKSIKNIALLWALFRRIYIFFVSHCLPHCLCRYRHLIDSFTHATSF